MAFNLSRSLCSRTLTLNPYILASRNVSLRVLPTPAVVAESHEDKNLRMKRPQSPHLTIYKYQLTSVLSITHRATGMALTAYAAALGLGAMTLPDGVGSIVSTVEALQLTAPTLLAAKFILAYPAAYHTVNGVRHLFWDMGKFLSIKEVYTTGYTMLLVSAILTGILCLL